MKVSKERFSEACEILREGLSIGEYLDSRGLLVGRVDSDRGLIRCPLPDHDDRTPSFSYDNVRRLFHCFGCGSAGDVLNLHYYLNKDSKNRYSRLRALRELVKEFKIKIPNLTEKKVKQGKVNKYTHRDIRLEDLGDEFYREKIRGLERSLRNLTDRDRLVRIYRLIDRMYFNDIGVQDTYNRVRDLMRG